MTVFNIIVIIITLLDLVCIVTVIFFERKSPTTTIAWILVLLFLPFGGFLAYVMFGSGFHINKRKKYAAKQAYDQFHRDVILKYIKQHGHRYDYDPDYAASRLIRYLEEDGRCLYSEDNAIELYTSGALLFERMKEDMRNARKHIHLLYYIIKNDQLGREIALILTDKARQGVKVRVLYDSLGSFLSFGGMFKELKRAGGEVQAFSPLLFSLSSHLRLNYRNHRKITVIDGQIGYVGGMNIGDEYRGRDKKLTPFRDTHLRLTGSSASCLQERFIQDWLYAMDIETGEEALAPYFPSPLRQDDKGVQIASSGPDTVHMPLRNGLLEMIFHARKNVYIQTPYFTPDDSFLDGLRIAARSGVDVRLMIPGISDNMLVQAATYSYAQQLVEAGVRIFQYQGFLHAKAVVYDGLAASIGTANIGTRSFSLNFEVNAFIYDKTFAGQYEEVFLADQDKCIELGREWFDRRTPLVRGMYSFARLLAPLM